MTFFGSTEIILIVLVAVIALILPLLALVDIVRNRFEGNNKLIWVIIVVFVNPIGSILYFTIGRRQKITSTSH